tara:strand:+ start:1295 stop:1564 length:270 start_codon:yes stop_codon:yes gene_type:complete
MCLSENYNIFSIPIETTVFDFKISKPFEEWAAIFDSEENKHMLSSLGIVPLYRGKNIDESSRAIVIFQSPKGVAMEMEIKPATKKNDYF